MDEASNAIRDAFALVTNMYNDPLDDPSASYTTASIMNDWRINLYDGQQVAFVLALGGIAKSCIDLSSQLAGVDKELMLDLLGKHINNE